MKRLSLLATLFATAFTPAFAASTVTVIHGKTPDPVYLDLGVEGASVGDQRIFEFGGATTEGEAVTLDFLMTTTGLPEDGSELENRMTVAVFTFGNGSGDRVMIEGLGQYPQAGSTVKVDAALERAIVGGTGKYAGARGTVVSTHLADGSWQHVLNLD
ncbi:hypothetical protein HYN69_19085 (plasmid) [Gemmobacter aquarius]|uniref:Uncharacterized protein n=1 Tax=Paragemmobacter aquarius TaxID=2169400 RepID=A0A2S0US93_9RHOB|nr:hypothetical protein [Gemmobacter aquarius]AWB50689.1 hypothetical protein HYN69_19085 [Gemmobacter aquarius]